MKARQHYFAIKHNVHQSVRITPYVGATDRTVDELKLKGILFYYFQCGIHGCFGFRFNNQSIARRAA